MTNGADSDELDREAMGRLAAGRDAALNELMERHADRLFRYLIRLLQNETDAGEIAQESFVRVYLNRAKFNPRLKFSTWLYAIATNLSRDLQRRHARHPEVSLDVESDAGPALRDTLPEPQDLPGQALESLERAEAVRHAVAALPQDLRVPLVLFEYEEKSHAEIGVILDCSAKAVEMKLYRARQQLRQTLAKVLAS